MNSRSTLLQPYEITKRSIQYLLLHYFAMIIDHKINPEARGWSNTDTPSMSGITILHPSCFRLDEKPFTIHKIWFRTPHNHYNILYILLYDVYPLWPPNTMSRYQTISTRPTCQSAHTVSPLYKKKSPHSCLPTRLTFEISLKTHLLTKKVKTPLNKGMTPRPSIRIQSSWCMAW